VWLSLALTVGAYFGAALVATLAILAREWLGHPPALLARLGLALVATPLALATGVPGARLALKARALRIGAVNMQRFDRKLPGGAAGPAVAIAFFSKEMAPLRAPLVLIAWNAFIAVAAEIIVLAVCLSGR
jgi:hypothetical protein